MNKPERAFWKWLDSATTGLWHCQRHEDKYSVGIPDISYGAGGVNGWIELKAYDKWPVKTLSHFTSKQANWLTNRGERGGHCFIIIRIKSTILMFDWKSAYDLRHKLCDERIMRSMAIVVWDSAFDRKEFSDIIGGVNGK